jgi:uncharacterized membrane protein YbhN (UPF0104 family)
LALFGWTLRGLDIEAAIRLLGSLGPLAALVLLPQAAGALCHAGAWRAVLAPLGGGATTAALYRLYVSAEAARMVAPAGPAVAESLAAVTLVRRHETPWGAAVGSLALKKAWVLGTHGVWMIGLLTVATDELTSLRAWVPPGVEPWWVASFMTIALLLTGLVTLLLLSSRRVATQVTGLLTRSPIRTIRAWAEERRQRGAGALRIPLRSHLTTATLLSAQWATEVLETWLVLRLLGAPASLPLALLLELGGAMVRSLAFMVPGGLGVQDASHVAMLSAIGVPGGTEIGAAFVVLKRLKDVVYVALGLTLLALAGRRHDTMTIPVST